MECGDGSNDAAGNATSPCALAVIDHNFRDPYIQNWTLGMQHAFTSNHFAGPFLRGKPWLTAKRHPRYQPRDPQCCRRSERDADGHALCSPVPVSLLHHRNVEPAMNPITTACRPRCNSGLPRAFFHGGLHLLPFHSMTIPINIGQYLPQDSTHPGREYASSDFDITHRFTFSLTYALPGKKSPGQLLEGWELNSIVTRADRPALVWERSVGQHQRDARRYGPLGLLRQQP